MGFIPSSRGTLALLLALATPAAALQLISASPTGVSGIDPSRYPVISSDGRYVVWMSSATNLVADIGPCDPQVQTYTVFLRDNLTDVTEQIAANGWFAAPAISASGRHVAYACGTVATEHICVRDRVTATTADLPISSFSSEPMNISADGRFVVYEGPYPQYSPTDPGYSSQIYVYDRCVSDGAPVVGCTAGSQLASTNGGPLGTNAANGESQSADITPDGRFVVFASRGTNLVAGTPSGHYVFVRDRCVTTGGTVPSCSPSTRLVSRASDGSLPTCIPATLEVSISDDGRFVAFGHCSNLTGDVLNTTFNSYVRDRDLDQNGTFDEAGPGMTSTELVSRATGAAGVAADFSARSPQISADGRYVSFVSGATNLDGPLEADLGDDLYLRDLLANTTRRLSTSPSGDPSQHYAGGFHYMTHAISGDGHAGAFSSIAQNLLPASDENGYSDVYLWADCAAAAPTCGDGTVYHGCEECDDGDTVDESNGCDANCRRTGCVNGRLTTGEDCDDGDMVDGNGCDNNCTLTACGNGIRTAGEECDDGNAIDGDGCSSTCVFELTSVVMGGGKKTTDCWHEFRTEPAPLADPRGLPRRELKCVDDDPSCDFGPATGDKACTFHVAFCFNVEDSRLLKDGVQQCATDEIETLNLTSPKQAAPKDAVETAIRDVVEATFEEIGACVSGFCTRPPSSVGILCLEDEHCDSYDTPGDGVCTGRIGVLDRPITATNGCTGYMDIVVPLKLRNGEYAKNKRSLGVNMEPTLDPVTFKVRKGDSDKLSLSCMPAP